MAEDIAPELLKKIQDMFRSGIDQDQRVAELKEKLDAGSATYHEAHEYASLVGGHMKDAYMEYLTSDNLPDGKCYYNIAERIIGTTEHEQYELVSQYAQEVQTELNKNAGIGMKAQAAGEDTTRVEGLVNVASNADQYDRVAKTVAQGVESMAREVVDRSVEKNAGFQRQSGLRPKIIRSSGGKCCDWCAALDGTYDYDKAPKEIYARHNNCTCTVEYDPGSGRRQDVWSKRWISEEELAKREELKTLGLDNLSGSDKINIRIQVNKKDFEQNNRYVRIPRLPASDISKLVENGTYSLRITPQQYNKHIIGHLDYERYKNSRAKKGKCPQSVLTISRDEAQNIINNKSGTGIVKARRDRTAMNIEFISCDRVIGMYYDHGKYHETTKAVIHYGGKGSHLVPVKGNDYD